MQRAVELIEELKSLRLKNAPGRHDQREHDPHKKSSKKVREELTGPNAQALGLEYGGTDKGFNSWYTYICPDGYHARLNVNASKEGKNGYPEPAGDGPGEYSITTDALGTRTLWVTNKKISTNYKDMDFQSASKKDAIEAAAAMLVKYNQTIEDTFNKAYDAAMQRESTRLSDSMQEYREYANPNTTRALLDTIRGDRISYREAKDTLNSLPTDADGTITLYRGGKEEGISWSTSRDEAERFARYGFGSVPVQASGLVGIYAVMGGAEQASVTVHERKFRKDELLLNMGGSEREVIVDPKAVGVKLKD